MSDAIFGLAGPPPDPPAISGKFRPFGEGGLSFKSLLDVINPLQHLPVVSSAYRAISGDEIGFVPRVLGGALFGGPIGLVAALVNAVVKEASGHDLGETVVAIATDEASSYVAADPVADQGAPGTIASSAGSGLVAGLAEGGTLMPLPQDTAPKAAAVGSAAPTPVTSAKGRGGMADARRMPSHAPVMPGIAQASPLQHFRVPSVASPTTSPAARPTRSDPASAAEIPDRSPDWFLRSISRGLEKYDRASKLDRSDNGTAKTRIDG